MLKVALTGNIGSGKTTASKIFSIMGVPIFDADNVAKQLYDKPDVIQKLIELFGYEIVDGKDNINKSMLANIVFKDNSKLKILTNFIHPLVKQEFKKWYSNLSTNIKYCIHESAVIFEGNFIDDIDYVITITAPKHIRYQRVMERNGWSEELINMRENNQIPEEKKIKLSDYVIINDEKQALLPQLIDIHNNLLKK
mgnify:FL=1